MDTRQISEFLVEVDKVYRYTIESNNPNHNSNEVTDFLNRLTNLQEDVIWLVTDLDLTPRYHCDYHPTGKREISNSVYEFNKRLETEHFILITLGELSSILNETICIRRGLFICLPNEIKLCDFYATVESECTESMLHESALHELRVLDDLIYILSKDRLIP